MTKYFIPETRILVCGSGALGSHIVRHLAKKGLTFYLLDDDTVEEQNIFVSTYTEQHIAMQKAEALAEIAEERGANAIPVVKTLENKAQIKDLEVDLVIDCFDNVEARAITCGLDVPTLHVGVGTEGNGIIFWDEAYQLPEGGKRGENTVCTNALGARIIRRASLRAAEVIEHYIATYEQEYDVVTEK